VRRHRGAERIAEVILVDQSQIGSTPRANAATYLRAWAGIRECFAKTDMARPAATTSAATFSIPLLGGCWVVQGSGCV
jgi:excinuclease ABC subunit A